MLLTFSSGINKLWQLFQKDGGCTSDQFKAAVKQAKISQLPLIEAFCDMEVLPPDRLLRIFSKYYGVPAMELKGKVISSYILRLLPKEVAEAHSIVVFKKDKDVIQVATTDPENKQTIDFVGQHTGLAVELFITTPADIDSALKKYNSDIGEEFGRIIQDSIDETLASHDTMEKIAEYVPVIKMVNTILDRAMARHASDIHIEPNGTKVTIRYRVDGLLHKIVELPKEVTAALVARIKLLSNLKIDEHRIPQDGRFKFNYNNRDVAVRVSIIPSLYGSKVVMRLLDSKEKQFSLNARGFNKRDLVILKEEIKKPHGMILVTGPTGSGKTTTLYTILKLLNKEQINISTIEDPIEYGLEGVNQMAVNNAAGLTFSNGLRSLLRQDPDVLMVGEIRDAETAEISVNSAMTGHLVLSTLHTNNAFLAPQRLVDMGVQSFVVGSVINLIIAQRLVRTVCDNCFRKVRSVPKLLERHGNSCDLASIIERLKTMDLLPANATLETMNFQEGVGCEECHDTGYQGRTGIYELVKVDEKMGEIIIHTHSADAIKKQALAAGTLTMLEDGLLKIFTGKTTFEEVLRVSKD